MIGNFYPPVIFEVKAIAGEALASFGAINKQLKTMEAQAVKTGKALTTLNKTAIVGTKVLKGFGVALVAAAALGVHEVIELEKSFNRLGQALANAGKSTVENRKSISELVDSYEQLGFGSEKAADAYSYLITATGDVTKSNNLLATAANLARARTISLEEASKLLVRAQAGNAKLFTQFGIVLDKSKPKAEALAEAMKKLEDRLSGQASAYAKTFAGQLAILNENLGDLFEAIGMKVLPVLNKFLSMLNNTGSWIKKNNDLVIALAAGITVLLIPAVVQLTKKLGLLFLTILRSPIARVAILIGGIAYMFVKAYNASEGFRKQFAKVGVAVITIAQVLYEAFVTLVGGLQLLERGGANLRITLGKAFGKDQWVKEGKAALDQIDKVNAGYTKTIKKFDDAKKSITDLAGKPLKLNFDFKIPQIPGFDNGDGKGFGDVIAENIKKGLINARQHIKDFNYDMRQEFKKAVDSWTSIINRDFVGEIETRLADNTDELVLQAKAAMAAYQQASNQYSAAMGKVASAQAKYLSAVASGNAKAIAAAESAMGRAEDAASAVAGAMNDALADVKKIQDDIIKKVVELKRQIADLEKERTKVLEEAQAERLKLEKDYNEEVAKLRKEYDKSVLNAQQDAARRSAEIVKQSVDQMRSVFKSATYRSLTDIYSGITYEGRYLQGGTASKIIANLGLQANKAQTLANDAASLAAAGFSQTFIEEVLALGPDMGHSLAETILTSTPESMAQIKSYWESLQRISTHGVDTIAESLNSGITLATEELTQQLADVQTELNRTLGDLNVELQDSLLEAWNSYAEAIDEVNKRTAKAIADIDAQIKALMDTIAQLMAALAMLAGLNKPGTVASPTTSTPIAPEIKASMQRFGYTNEQQFYKFLDKRTGDIIINAQTNASPQSIANDVGWAIRTSGDVQYRSR